MRRGVVLTLVVLVVLAGLAGGGAWYARQRVLKELAPLSARGTIQSETADVVARIGGRVRLVAVSPGDAVRAGQLIAWLDAPELKAAVADAEGQVRDLKRQIDALHQSAPGGARGAYARAQRRLTDAQRSLANAQELSSSEPELAARVETLRGAADQAGAELRAAEARLEEAKAAAGAAHEPQPLESGADRTAGGAENAGGAPPPVAVPTEDPAVQAAQESVNDARKRKRDADRELAAAVAKHDDAVKALGRIASLTAEVQDASSAAEAARAEVAREAAAPSDGAEQALRAQVREAQAVASAARMRLQDVVITAPAGGVVEQVVVRSGDVIAPGQPIVSIRGAGAIWAEANVPADSVGLIRPNKPAVARADSVPGVTFQGTVAEIVRGEARGTAPVQVRVSLEDPKHLLRSGTEVEITFPRR